VKERVYILATVRKPSLIDAATLVFRTLRVGFPTAAVTVQTNWFAPGSHHAMAEACRQVDARLEEPGFITQHDRWIARLLETAHEPFWLCDTDVVFFGSMENLGIEGEPYMVGEYQPAFLEEFTRTIHVERLHTCLLWMDPVRLRDRVREWHSRFPDPPAVQAMRVLVHQTYVPTPRGVLFYDSGAGLYHAVGGTRMPDNALERFEHLNAATYIDLIAPALADAPALAEVHRQVYENPSRAKGLRAGQAEYYRRRAPSETIH